ncbi:neurotransmitter-gated ion-channel ligand binding domain protein [Francisella philomiragia]|uniref:ligand-gated ion channel n=1 Tax=Francisella philomiragia TaxID=28110 RepID=UPI0005A57BFF|nr:ligand-gated ion channel [Francisella philomiragia]AJI54568.1 neurotransmitter-gated ion-channel ligand binding domain protein [Francisella philomiragia]MBK2252848.1 ligand-gated ion channel [Francisella philomiragia]
MLSSKHLKVFFLLLISLSYYKNIFGYGSTPPLTPTIVKTSAFITDIQSLDEVNEQLQIDVIFRFKWNDPRLKFDKNDEKTLYKLYQGDFQYDEIFEGWRPQISIINEVGSPQIKARQIKIYPNGDIIYTEQRTLHLETPMQLEKFPFDKQTLKAYIIPFGYNSSEVKLVVEPNHRITVEDYVKDHPNINIAEWHLANFNLTDTEPTKYYYGKSEKISMLEFSISLERKPTNILLKVLIPLTLLVLAMWAVFWMDTKALSDRLNIAFIGILSVIAYQFLIEGEMPDIDYLTFTDGFLLLSFTILFSTVLESLIVYWLIKSNKHIFAKKLDIFSRFAFPITYILFIFTLYIIYLR